MSAVRDYLPWLLSVITIWMTLAAGNKHPSAWLIGLVNQALWLTWIVSAQAWGLLPMNLALWVVYGRNHLKWRASSPGQQQAGRWHLMRLFRLFWFKYFLKHFQWYRRWYGGRWEYHWVDVCGSSMWLDMAPDRCWPGYRQPCTFGTPIVEDYPQPWRYIAAMDTRPRATHVAPKAGA